MPVTALGPARLPPVQPVAEAGLALPDRRVGGPPSPLPPLGQVEPPCPVRCTPLPRTFLEGIRKLPLGQRRHRMYMV